MKKKKIITVIIVIIIIYALGTTISAQDENYLTDLTDLTEETPVFDEQIINYIIENSIILQVNNPKTLVNGKITYIDENNLNVVPFINENNRTLVPVRFIAENSGWDVEYNANIQQVTLSKFSMRFHSINMYIDLNMLVYDDQTIIIDSAPVLNQDRTFIPLRAFVETVLEMNILYISQDQIIIISEIYTGEDDSEFINEIAEEAKSRFNCCDNINDINDIDVNDENNNFINNIEFVYPVSYPDKNGAIKYYMDGWSGPQYDSFFNPQHLAVDFNSAAANKDLDIFAIYPGMVVDIIYSSIGYGNRVILSHTLSDGTVFYSLYAHLEEIKVSRDDEVYASQIIGKMGNTGNSSGIHLHIAVWTGRISTNPESEIENPTSSEEVTSTGKATGIYGRIFYDIHKIIELQNLF